MENKNEVFTVKEVAQLLKISEKLVRAEIKRKRLGANLIGDEYRITRHDLDTYMTLTHTANQPEDLAPVA